MLAYPSSQKPPRKSASRRAMWPCSLLQTNLLVFLYSAPGYLRQSSYPIAVVSLLFLQFWKSLETFKAMGKPTENQQSSFSTLCFRKITKNNKQQQKIRKLFLNVTVHFKGFQVIFIFLIISQSMTNPYSANLYFSNTVPTSPTLSALSKAAAHRYFWCTEIS